MEVLRGLMCRTVTITDAADEEVPWSPIPAAILPADSCSTAFRAGWPLATHSFWAYEAGYLRPDHCLSWLNPDGITVRARTVGRVEGIEGAPGDGRRVPIRVMQEGER